MTLEKEIAIYEAARNIAMDEYFEARPLINRTRENERFFEAGFRKSWEYLTNTNRESKKNICDLLNE